jgi:hypothetical protein
VSRLRRSIRLLSLPRPSGLGYRGRNARFRPFGAPLTKSAQYARPIVSVKIA